MTTVGKSVKDYSTFDPRYIPGCIFWIDPSDSSSLTVDVGNNVTRIRDKSVSANDAITLTTAPKLGTFSTGRTAINFQGSQALQVSDRTKLPNGANSAHSFFTIVESTNNAVQGIMTWGDFGSNNAMEYYLTTGGGAGSPGLAVFQFNQAGSSTFDSTTISGPTILSGTASSTSVRGWRNGNAFSNAASAGLGTNIGTTVSNIGCLNGISIAPLTGRVGEIIIYNRVISDTERQQIEGYLAWKWLVQTNLPVAHPYTSTGRHGPYLTIIRPTDLSNCSLWLDAADPTTITFSTGTSVTSWRDKSAIANNATNSGSGQPVYISSTNSVYFASATVNLVTVSNISASGNTSRTLFMVTDLPNTSSRAILASGTQAANTPPSAFGIDQNAAATQLYAPYVFTAADNLFSVALTGKNCLYAYYDSSVSQIGGGYNFTGFTTRNTTLNTTATPWYLGARPGGTGSVTASFNEIIFYSRAISAQERQQIEGYLAWKWGLTGTLPSTHPFKSFPPLFINP